MTEHTDDNQPAADEMFEDDHPDCAAQGCDIREGDLECRRCGAEAALDDADED